MMQNVLAKMVIKRVPSIEVVRFVNSGTEACLSVLRYLSETSFQVPASRDNAESLNPSVKEIIACVLPINGTPHRA